MEPTKLNDYFTLHKDYLIQINSNVIEVLRDLIREITTCDDAAKGVAKIRKSALVRAQASNETELISAPRLVIDKWIKLMNFVNPQMPGLKSNSDLQSGKYEGGFKVWESTYDLIKFINEDNVVIGDLLHRDGKIRLLELGAGSGLASLAFLTRLLHEPDFKFNYKIHLQDYNWQVLTTLTILNMGLNLPHEYLKEMLDLKAIRVFSGDWNNFSYKHKYHIIIMSEVIYNSKFYCSLHALLEKQLKNPGVIIIATKDTYFGLSGGLYSWLDFIKTKGIFYPANILKVSQNNIPRSILIMRRINLISSEPQQVQDQ